MKKIILLPAVAPSAANQSEIQQPRWLSGSRFKSAVICFSFFIFHFSFFIDASAQGFSLNTSGTANSSLSMLEILQISTTANTKGLHVAHSGAISGTGYGIWAEKTGGSTTNIAGYFSASGGTNNYAIIVPSTGGSVGIGTTGPNSKLDVVGSTIYHGVVSIMTLDPNADVAGGLLFESQGAQKWFLSTRQSTSDYDLYLSRYDGSNWQDMVAFDRSTGNVGIGTTSPTSILHTIASGAQTAAYTGNLLTNTATSSTASISKIGLDVQSTGTWNGASATNTGLNVNVSGGTTNYAATFQGGNVGIGTITPDASALLDATSTNKGVLLPRLALTGTTSASPVSSPATGLIAYNTATVSDVTPGFYYWDGTKWVRLITTSGASTNSHCFTCDGF